MGNNITEGSKKRRRRTPTSCSVCRKRRIKCDKLKPTCGRCLQSNIAHLCHYDLNYWASDTKNTSEIIVKMEREINELRKRIQLLSSTDGIYKTPSNDSSTTTTCNMTSNRPESQITDLTDEKCRNYKHFVIKNLKIRYVGMSSYMFWLANDPYLASIFGAYSKDQLKKFKAKSSGIEIQNDNEYSKDSPTIEDCSRNLVAKNDRIPSVPPPMISNRLVKRFFRKCYFFAPFIDEKTFLNEIASIFMEKDYIDERDLLYKPVIISMFLVVLRFSYLTLPWKKAVNGELGKDDLDLIEQISNSGVKITPAYLEFSLQLLTERSKFNRLDFKKIQALLLLRICQLHSPEDDYLSPDSSILNSTIVQLAILHGLHRNPKEFTELDLRNNDIFLWNKVWSTILYIDSKQAFEDGLSLLFSKEVENEEFPFEANSSFWLSDQELQLEKLLRIQYTVTKLTRKAVKLLNSVEDQVDEHSLSLLASEFEDLAYKQMPSFDDFFSNSHQIDEAENAQTFAFKLSMLQTIFTISFIRYRVSTIKKFELQAFYSTLEAGLLVLKVALQFSENCASVASNEMATLIAPDIWNPEKTVITNLGSILIPVAKGESSLIDAIKYSNRRRKMSL